MLSAQCGEKYGEKKEKRKRSFNTNEWKRKKKKALKEHEKNTMKVGN